MSYENTRISHKSRIPALAFAIALTLLCARTTFAQERAVAGTIELGNRWRWFSGNEDVYRSTINLGRGPKLQSLSATFTPANAGKSLFDKATIDMSGWGGEPSSVLRFSSALANRYELHVNYRHFDYFNSLPSFANPTQSRAGATQSSMDVSRRIADVRLTLRPNSRISPFAGFEYDSNFGPGRTNFVQDSNEYTVATKIDNATRTFIGGVSLRFDRWSGSVEAGASSFHDAQNVSVSGPNLGNRTTLFLGQRLQLDSLEQTYRVSGDDRFTRASVNLRPWRKLTLFGQYSYSRPTTESTYVDAGSGRFVLLSTLESFAGENTLTIGRARYPHPSGAAGLEFRPMDRLRMVETVSTDQFRIHGNGSSEQSFSSSTTRVAETFDETLKARFTRQRFDVIFDLNSVASLHAGHSYLTTTATSPGSKLLNAETHDLVRNAADVGLALRIMNRLKVNVDFDDDRGDATFFRTDRRDFQRLRARGRYRVTDVLELGLTASLWNNDNTASDIDFIERSREQSIEVTLAPNAGKLISLDASYSRGTFHSDLPIIVPQNFQMERSIYNDRGHNGTVMVTLNPVSRLRATIGGDLFITSSETRPTRFYNPNVKVSFNLNSRAAFNAGWSWHEYSNRSFSRESYQAHLFTTGFAYRLE